MSSNSNASTPKATIGLIGFFMMTGSMVMTIYSYPAFATSGLSLIFYLLFAGALFFIPTALVSAELATGKGWETGGVYTWCAAAFGRRWGFTAIFLQWLQITVGFVTMLYFITGAASYLFDWPALNTNPIIKLMGVLILFWLITFLNFFGTKWTARFATIGLIGGVTIPAVLLIGLGITYMVQGHPVEIQFSWGKLIPDFTNIQTMVILVAFILSYAGIEASAPHVNELENPRKNYPIAIIMLTIFDILVNILGSLSIAIVIPESQINLSAGVLQTFKMLLDMYHIGWLLKIMAALLAVGTIAEVSAWVVGPSKGMVAAAHDGLLPAIFTKENKNDVPVNFVLAQGVVVTIWACILTLGGGGNNLSFLLAMALTVVTYLAMYILLFLSYAHLKFKQTDVERAYVVPGGNAGGMLVTVVGVIMAVFAMVVSFFPPASIGKNEDGAYSSILIISFIVVMVLPHILYALRQKDKDGKVPTTMKRIKGWHHMHSLHPRGRYPYEIDRSKK